MDELAPLRSFLSGIFLDGRAVVVAATTDGGSAETGQVVAILKQAHHLAADDAPASPPSFDEHAAIWGAEVLFWSCSRLLDRMATETDLPKRLTESEPKGDQTCQHWSVDLALRFLTTVIQRSERIAKDDPLGTTLAQVASRWPLSAPGSEVEVDPLRLALITRDECLRGVMVDRTIQRKDKQLSKHPLLRDFLLRAVGANVDWLP